MIVLGCWKTGTERIMETSDPAVGCLSIGWMFGWWGMSDVAVGRLDDEESWMDGWLSFAWIDVVLFGSSFLLLWGSVMVVLSSQHLRCEMSGQFVLHHYYGSGEHERENVLHNDCWVLDEDREEMFFSSGFRFVTQLVDSRCVVFCRVLPCRPSILSDRLVLRWILDHSPSMHRAWILVSVWLESVRLFSRIVFIAVSSVGFFHHV